MRGVSEKILMGLRRNDGLKRLVSEKRAIVACILRPSTSSADDHEALFILRSGGEGRWAGQVAFPGGHVELGETDHECVSRECKEEVGLELDEPGAYTFLGETRQLRVPFKRELVVTCRVYEQVPSAAAGGGLPRDLCLKEVAACGWCSLAALRADNIAVPLKWAASHPGADPDEWDGFASFLLPIRCVRIPAGSPEVESDGEAGGVDSKFVLWGLTLHIVNDLLTTTGLRATPIELVEHVDGDAKL